jgi:ATP-binding cassette subfamily C protein
MKRARTPTVIQMEAVECGAAALAIIMGYYGAFIPLEELRVRCGVSRDGSNALNIVKAARFYGFEGKGIKAEIEDLRTEKFPLIVFWGFQHYVVVEGFGKNKVYINDPAAGPRQVSLEEFDEFYTGIALLFEPTEKFQKTKTPKKLFRLIKERLHDVKEPLIFLGLCGIGLLFPGLFMPAINQVFFDSVLQQGYLSWVAPIFLLILALTLITFLFTWLQNRYLNRLNLRLNATFSMEFLWHLIHLPLQFYAQRFSGEVSYRMRLNTSSAKTLTGTLAPTIVNITLIIFYLIVMLSYDKVIATIGIIAAALNLLVLWFINRSRNDAYARMQQELSKSVGFAIGALQNIETIKAAGNEGDFFTRWSGYNTKKLNAQREINVKDVILTSVPTFLQGMAMTALLGIGAWRIIRGDLSVGMLMAMQALMTSFLTPVNQIVFLGNQLQTLKIDVDRLNDVIKNKVDLTYVTPKKEVANEKKLEGYLELKNITFGYSPLDPPLIEDFSFTLKPGQRIAFVGPTGSGKSTLAKLICGLYQPWEGEILYDGININEIPRSVLTNSLGLVDQSVTLFSGTIRENLSLWDSTISEEAMINAGKDASIHDEILMRQGGYDAPVLENGRNFSGGQRQRIEIAKSLVGNPRILVMDEATSTLDSVTEVIISQNVRRRGCTCVMVAHRLSTIRDCDEIIVLDKGKIVQRGSHDQLKSVPGTYQELVGKEQM